MVRALRRHAAVLLSAALGGSGCDATGPVPDFDETPTVALLITPAPPLPLHAETRLDSGLFATLVTTGTPIRSPYLRADHFEMRRLSDGARFAWRAIDPPGDAIPAMGPRSMGNYFLPRSGSTGFLGSDSIAEGGVYELVAQAGRHQIIGRTRVPGKIEFVREPADGDSIVRWRSAVGAALYLFGGDLFYGARRIADTAIVVSRRPPRPGEPSFPEVIQVFAVDSNYAAFRSDLRASQAGISGGWGVFGSYTSAELELPPRAASTTPP
jgi:hypothetical protein